jgi:hypothetical protein
VREKALRNLCCGAPVGWDRLSKLFTAVPGALSAGIRPGARSRCTNGALAVHCLVEIRLCLAVANARERRGFGWQARCELLCLLHQTPIELRPYARCDGGAMSLEVNIVNLHVRRWRGPRILLFGERITAEAHDL